jgi:CubicO group peptidase (beta-lactamase class C family)
MGSRHLAGLCVGRWCALLLGLLTAGSWAAAPPTPEQIAAARAYHEASGGQGLVVLHEGRLLHESYANGGSPTAQVLLASGTKGFTGLFGAMLAEDGVYRLDDVVAEVVPEWRSDPRRSRITWRHLLTMTSGLDDVKDQSTWESFLRAEAVAEPGTLFDYGSAPNVFGAALQRKLGNEKVADYMQRRLFGPLGIQVSWRGSFSDGNPQLSGGAYARTREWANLGELVRLGGVWNGRRLISQALLEEVLTGTSANPAYGLYWWLNREVPDTLARTAPQFERHLLSLIEAPFLPDDFTMAAGAYEQRLYVIPSLQLVVARNGPRSAAGRFDDVAFLSRLLPAAPPRNRTGLYFAPSEAGWALALSQLGNEVFPLWISYGEDGSPEWFTVESLTADAQGVLRGPLQRWSGSAFTPGAALVPPQRTATRLGTASLRFGSNGELEFGVQLGTEPLRTRTLVPLALDARPPVCVFTVGSQSAARNLSGMWWNPEVPGWGLVAVHQGNRLFVGWLGFDSDGTTGWAAGLLERGSDGSFRGELGRPLAGEPFNRRTGQAATPLPLPAAGSMTLRALDGERLTVDFAVGSQRSSTTVRRLSGALPLTECRD